MEVTAKVTSAQKEVLIMVCWNASKSIMMLEKCVAAQGNTLEEVLYK
jgi:hypothetical protein